MNRAFASAAIRNPDGAHARPGLPSYRRVLEWALTVSSSARILSYLPTLWAVHRSGDATQHSLWTWGTWVIANLTMTAWLYESNGCRFDRVVAVNCGNTLMCTLTFILIAAYRS
jgi:hypothetical protein